MESQRLSRLLSAIAGQFDAEGGANAHFAALYEDAPHVVLLDNPSGEGQAEAPSALLGGETRAEYIAYVAGRDAAARVRNLDDNAD